MIASHGMSECMSLPIRQFWTRTYKKRCVHCLHCESYRTKLQYLHTYTWMDSDNFSSVYTYTKTFTLYSLMWSSARDGVLIIARDRLHGRHNPKRRRAQDRIYLILIFRSDLWFITNLARFLSDLLSPSHDVCVSWTEVGSPSPSASRVCCDAVNLPGTRPPSEPNSIRTSGFRSNKKSRDTFASHEIPYRNYEPWR